MDINIKKPSFNDKDYKFDLSIMSGKDWTHFMFDVLLSKLENIEGVKTPSIKLSIRDNVAKVMISWLELDESYHEFTFHLDEFGRKSENYQDLISNIWQNIMTEHYHEAYIQELNKTLSEVRTQII